MKNLILIHGALGNANELSALAKDFESQFNVYCYDIPGHGKRSNELAKFTLNGLVADFEQYLSRVGETYVFGFSLGGYLALSTALKNSSFIKGIVTLGTKVHWSDNEAQKEVRNLDLRLLAEQAPSFYSYLNDLHGPHLEELCKATAVFMTELGQTPPLNPVSVQQIDIPVRMVRGGKDKMVDAQSTLELVAAMKNAFYTEIPSFIHPLGFLKSSHVKRMLDTQLKSMDYQWINLKESEIAYTFIGKPIENEPLIVFLHEGLGSVAQWGDFPEKVCKRLKLPALVYDRVGYGFSSENKSNRTDKYLHESALNELPELLERLNITNTLLLIGHSDGGSIALLYAAKYPHRIHGLVTMAAHIYNESVTIEGIVRARNAWKEGKMKGLEMYHGAKTEKLFFDWNDTWQTPAFLKWNIEGECPVDSEFPALIIQGETDQYGSPSQVFDIVRVLGKNAEGVMIENAGHSPFIDAEEVVLNEIEEVFEE